MRLTRTDADQLVFKALIYSKAYKIDNDLESIIFIVIDILEPRLDRRNRPKLVTSYNEQILNFKEKKMKKTTNFNSFGAIEFLAVLAPATFYILILYVLLKGVLF